MICRNCNQMCNQGRRCELESLRAAKFNDRISAILERVPYAFQGKPLRERRIQPAVIKCPSECTWAHRLINVSALILLIGIVGFLAGWGKHL